MPSPYAWTRTPKNRRPVPARWTLALGALIAYALIGACFYTYILSF